MDLLRAAVLGIVQGLSEFLPISSSGHLILVPALFRWPDQGLAFDVSLHAGTLVALLVYFWRDWYDMAAAALDDLGARRLAPARWSPPTRLLALLALGSVPAALAGLALQSWIEDNVRQPWLVAILLGAFGVVMLAADRFSRRERGFHCLGVRDAVLVGLAQAAALIPGVSRSGATITAGLSLGFRRDEAARFAFLLGTPALFGAFLLQAPKLVSDSSEYGPVLVGFLTSMAVGFVVIHALLRYLRARSLVPFVAYRFAVAILALTIAALRVA